MTLAMVLRSERELLGANKEMEEEIGQLKSMLETRNREVEKLKDLCLKQREEIKSLKNADLSSCEATTPGSPDDDMFIKDLNPCLTPYVAKANSKEFDEMGYDCSSSYEEHLPETTMQVSDEPTFSSN
ncbi:unnamed protein product [Linum tenue]|uniref:Uncharacterized protein n=1 Tax=Linum tenue TaxID=586396 RepID=A0AAV0NQT9_9ROSI|nr:unnamed protein product [Linum tenue]